MKMRDIEGKFDVPEPEGWWTLTVTGSGPLYVVATMLQGDARRFVPVSARNRPYSQSKGQGREMG